ncbi:GNAT family N-acetyltransferase, partial [Kitasatospora sp. NPDC097691]|uniref:GNAT family N-acetyltransferase n=1 Tax=Kitasatospora sp. NPDC097691 TaxID=3157231 RepID=UPI00331C548E
VAKAVTDLQKQADNVQQAADKNQPTDGPGPGAGARAGPILDRVPLISLHDRAALAARFRTDPALHLFELGDLDEPTWHNTTWYTASAEHGPVALLFSGGDTPVLLAFARPTAVPPLEALLGDLRPFLPRRFTAGLPDGAERALAPDYAVERRTPLLRMLLTDGLPDADVDHGAEPLTTDDLPAVRALLAESYPEAWFDPRMLSGGDYVGVRRDGRLLAVAGVHVHSPVQRVAVLGNVTTHPDARGRGLARACVTALCRHLAATTDHLGLNVRTDNAPAIRLYERLGFTTVATYNELVLGTA